MEDILKEYYKNCTERHIGGYDQAKYAGILTGRETELLEMLGEEGLSLYESFMEAGGDLSYETSRESFAKGFTLGALLMEAIMETKAGIFGK